MNLLLMCTGRLLACRTVQPTGPNVDLVRNWSLLRIRQYKQHTDHSSRDVVSIRNRPGDNSLPPRQIHTRRRWDSDTSGRTRRNRRCRDSCPQSPFRCYRKSSVGKIADWERSARSLHLGKIGAFHHRRGRRRTRKWKPQGRLRTRGFVVHFSFWFGFTATRSRSWAVLLEMASQRDWTVGYMCFS